MKKIFKKSPSNKINGAKSALFFLWRAPTHDSFTFNLRFLYELKHKVCLSKTVCRIFYFRFCFVFIFIQQNTWTHKNAIIPFKIKIIEIPHIVLFPDL